MKLTVYFPDRDSPKATVAEVQRIFATAGFLAYVSEGALVVDPVPAFLTQDAPAVVAAPRVEPQVETMPSNVARIGKRKRA